MCVHTFYGGEFEGRGVQRLDPVGLHSDVGFLQAVFLQQVIHLQQMFPKVLRQQLDLRGIEGWRDRERRERGEKWQRKAMMTLGAQLCRST